MEAVMSCCATLGIFLWSNASTVFSVDLGSCPCSAGELHTVLVVLGCILQVGVRFAVRMIVVSAL